MSEEKKIEETIRSMAKVSMFEGKLNDIQLKNLKMFPMVFFNGVSKVAIDYNLDMGKAHVDYEIYETPDKTKDIKYDIQLPKNNTSITYHITIDAFDAALMNDFLPQRFQALEKAISDLFWTGIKIKVLFNEKLVYENNHGK